MHCYEIFINEVKERTAIIWGKDTQEAYLEHGDGLRRSDVTVMMGDGERFH